MSKPAADHGAHVGLLMFYPVLITSMLTSSTPSVLPRLHMRPGRRWSSMGVRLPVCVESSNFKCWLMRAFIRDEGRSLRALITNKGFASSAAAIALNNMDTNRPPSASTSTGMWQNVSSPRVPVKLAIDFVCARSGNSSGPVHLHHRQLLPSSSGRVPRSSIQAVDPGDGRQSGRAL